MMMDCPTSEKNPNLQPMEEEEEEEEQEKDSAESSSLYLHLLSHTIVGKDKGNFSLFYKIDSSSDEPNFSQKAKLISVKVPKNLPYIGFGYAVCDSILYLFGGGGTISSIYRPSNKAGYIDLAAASSGNMKKFVPLEHTMNANRSFPITVTVGKKICIFGSGNMGYGISLRATETREIWAEVFNTEDKLFKHTSLPPPELFEANWVGLAAVISQNEILLATQYFSHMFIYNVETDEWNYKSTGVVSPFWLCSVRSPVIQNKYIFLYGNGKICAFDLYKNQFLKNNISLSEYIIFYDEEDEEGVDLPAVIHHRGGWNFSVVLADAAGYLFRFIYIVSFEIENPEHCGELNIKADTIDVVDHVLPGHAFAGSLLWSNQIVPSGNPNNGKRSLKKKLIVGGSSVTSHVDEDCMMNNNGATSRPELSKLRRKEAVLRKEICEMRLLMENLEMDKLERSKTKLSKTNMAECVKNENVSEIKTGSLLEDRSSILKKVEAQLIERNKLMDQIHLARRAV